MPRPRCLPGVEVLHLSEAEAYLRIRAARVSRKYPVILKMLADGRLHLSAIAKLAPYLDKEGATSLLARASHRSKFEIQQLIAAIAPRPDVKQSLRRLPEAPGVTSPPASLLDQALLNGGMSSPVTTVGRLIDPEPTAGGPGSSLLATSGTRGATGTITATPEALGALFRREQVVAEPNAAPTAVAARIVASRGLRPDAVVPLSPGRYALHLTLDADQHARLQRLRALTGGLDLAGVIDGAVSKALERIDARRFGKIKPRVKARRTSRAKALVNSNSPVEIRAIQVDSKRQSLPVVRAQARTAAVGASQGPGATSAVSAVGVRSVASASGAVEALRGASRHIPAGVRRAVAERDGNQCRFVSTAGRRCTARECLEFHHRHPFAFGGTHDPDNLRLMCRTHNMFLAEADYGKKAMAKFQTADG